APRPLALPAVEEQRIRSARTFAPGTPLGGGARGAQRGAPPPSCPTYRPAFRSQGAPRPRRGQLCAAGREGQGWAAVRRPRSPGRPAPRTGHAAGRGAVVRTVRPGARGSGAPRPDRGWWRGPASFARTAGSGARRTPRSASEHGPLDVPGAGEQLALG